MSLAGLFDHNQFGAGNTNAQKRNANIVDSLLFSHSSGQCTLFSA
jgi:hypothetical protein